MAVAASVKTIITIKGNDQASKSIKKSTTAMGKLQTSMGKASEKSRALGSSLRNIGSGNITGALSDVGGLLGGGAGGIAAAAAAATAAAAALAVGIGVAALKFTEWSSEIERTRAALDNTFGGQGVEKAIAFAREIGGVGVDSVQKLATTLKASGINANITAKQMQELANRATQMGKSGDEALTAFAEAIQKGTTRSLAQVGVFVSMTKAQEDYLEGTGRSAESMSQLEKQQAVLNAVTRSLTASTGASSAMYSKQDNVLARLSIAWTELKFTISGYLAGPAAGLLENVADTIELGSKLARVTLAAWNTGFTVLLTPVRAVSVALGGIYKVVQSLVSGGGLRGMGKALDDVIGSAGGFVYGKIADDFGKIADEIGRVGEKAKKTAKQIDFVGSSYAFTAEMAAKFSAGIAKRAKLEGDLARKRAKRAANARAAASKAQAFRKLRIASIREMQDLENKAKQSAAAGMPLDVARIKNLKIELDTNRKIEAVFANKSLSAVERQRTITAVRAIAHKAQMANTAAGRQAVIAAQDAINKSKDAAAKKEKAAHDAQMTARAAMVTSENQLSQIRAANNPAELARLQNMQTEAELQRKIADIRQNLSLSEIEQRRTIDAVRGIAHEKQMARLTEATNAERAANQARIQGALAIAQAGVGLLKAVDANARVVAGIQMALATAQAFLSFAMGDYVGAIAAATAAVNFGKIAFSSPEQPPSLSSSSAAASASPGIAAPASSGGGGSSSFNITINGVFATAAETGAALKQAIGAASATGMQGT